MTSTFHDEFKEYQQARRNFWSRLTGAGRKSFGDYYRALLKNIYGNLIPEDTRVLELGCGCGDLIASLKPSFGVGIDFAEPVIDRARQSHSGITFHVGDAHGLQDLDEGTFDYIILSDLPNDLWDVQGVLTELRRFCNPETRLIFNIYSHLWNFPLLMARRLGLASPVLTQNWLTPHDIENMLEISGYQSLRAWSEILVPIDIPWISKFANRYLAKIFPLRFLNLSNFIVARPRGLSDDKDQSVSVVVAARNESGHIDELLARIPEMGLGTEIIFVEGNSTDDTYEAIERAIQANPHRKCRLLKQTGRGKGDAVRAGFDAATGDVLMILDADITVPPEDLPRFYALIKDGTAEFVNGVRLVYPMEDDAMRFANLIGNKFFSYAFSWLLGQPIRDTLCGTKVLSRSDYRRISDNRAYFGDFDPFGDFDLLFGAARLNLKILEVPIRYRARRYGETNISRWKHGVLLLRMVAFAARRIKFV